MLPLLPKLTCDDFRAALGSAWCEGAIGQIELPIPLLDLLNAQFEQQSRDAGARVESLRNAQLGSVAEVISRAVVCVKPREMALRVAFALVERWLVLANALQPSGVEAAWVATERLSRRGTLASIGELISALDPLVVDPLTVFVAGPITNATPDETEALITISSSLRAELVQLRVRLYSAPEEADSRVHNIFADDETWRDVDEHWIRRSDLVVILHPRGATGLGAVHEIARGACVPVLVVSDKPITPMVARATSPERILASHNVIERVTAYIADHEEQMRHRRTEVRRLAETAWRKGRLRLKHDIEVLSDEGLVGWLPSTITRERVQEILHDDYAYGSMTDFERSQLRQAFSLPKLPMLNQHARRAIAQAARNNGWSAEEVWTVEREGRETLGEADDQIRHYASPHDPAFWEKIHRDIYS